MIMQGWDLSSKPRISSARTAFCGTSQALSVDSLEYEVPTCDADELDNACVVEQTLSYGLFGSRIKRMYSPGLALPL